MKCGSDTIECIMKRFEELTLNELYEILRLRAEVFVVEQDCPYQDLDRKDYDAYHMFLKDESEIVAVLRILPENVAFEDMAIGRLIVSKDYRSRGLSRMMMEKAMEFITDELEKDRIRLSGQAYLEDFYTSLGFRKVSDEYLEDGIRHYEFFYEK